MALRLLTGKTGSGKSYEAVSLIVDILDTGKKVFTNIKLDIDYDNYIYLDELAIKNFLSYIGDTFSNVENLEDKKNELQITEYFNADFFIDEAHLVGFRDKKEAVLNWLTIHRHFNQNITVITQIASNVHRDYLQLFHTHIDMIAPNKRLSKNSMGFREYDSYKGDRLRTKYFKPRPEIFSIYNSGNVEQGINQDVFKLAFLVLGLVGLSFGAWWSTSSFFDNRINISPDLNKTSSFSPLENMKEVGVKKTLLVKDINSSSVIKEDSVICSNLNGCYYGAIKYTSNSFRMFVLSKRKYTKTLIAVFHSDNKKERLTKYSFLVSQ